MSFTRSLTKSTLTTFLAVQHPPQERLGKHSWKDKPNPTTASISPSSLCSSNSRRTETSSSIHQNEDGECVFGLKSFWDDMYTGAGDGDRPANKYSWYCGWGELAPFWNMIVPDKVNSRVLIAGIGNDMTPIDMYDAGWNASMTAFDYSAPGVERAKQLFGATRREHVKLLTADARNLPLADASIDATLDKGTLDAIYITGRDAFHDSVKELTRVTATDGVVVCVSRVIYSEELMGAFESENWQNFLNGELAFAPDGEATIDLGAELYAWRRKDVTVSEEK